MKKKLIKILLCLSAMVLVVNIMSREASASGNATVYKSVQVAPNIQARVLYIHKGYAGPSVGDTYHTNLIISKHNGTKYVDRRNYHITAKTSNGSVCWNIWDSVTKKEYKNCHAGLNKSGAQSAMHSMLKELIGVYLGNNYQGVALLIALIAIVWNAWPMARVSLAG